MQQTIHKLAYDLVSAGGFTEAQPGGLIFTAPKAAADALLLALAADPMPPSAMVEIIAAEVKAFSEPAWTPPAPGCIPDGEEGGPDALAFFNDVRERLLNVGALTIDGGESVADVLAAFLAYERDAFENDTPIDLCDLCTFVGTIRTRLAAALTNTPFGGVAPAIVQRALTVGAGYLADAEEDQTSGEADGIYEEDPEISERLAQDDTLFGMAAECLMGNAPQRTLYVMVDGGTVQEVRCADETPDLSVVVIDTDVEDADRGVLSMVDQADPEDPHANKYADRWRASRVMDMDIDRAPKPAMLPAGDAQFDEKFGE